MTVDRGVSLGCAKGGMERLVAQGETHSRLFVEIPNNDNAIDREAIEDDDGMMATFEKYSTRAGKMNIQGLSKCMRDFGLLDGRSAQESRDAVVAMFANLDVRRKNYIHAEEFENMWVKMNAPRLGDVISQEDPDMEKALFDAFCSWSAFGSPKESYTRRRNEEIMGSFHWNKICRDVGLVAPGGHTPSSSSRHVSFSDADIMFAKVKGRGKRKINFSQFVDALGLLAEKLGMDVMDIVHLILQKSKPSLNGTVVSTPTFCPSTVRYNIFKRDLVVSPKMVQADCRTKEAGHSTEGPTSHGSTEEDMLLHIYGQYARFGHRQKFQTRSDIQMSMTDQQFAKLCRECGIAIPMMKVDVIFSKAKRPGKNSLMFEDFVFALSMIASEQGTDEKSIHALVCRNTAGPRIHSHHATQFVRLHDDPSTQCGVYGRRQPCIR